MKKHNTERREQKGKGRKTIGLDLGDRTSRYCVVDEQGEVILEGSVATTESALRSWVEEMGACVVAMEVGTHSPWVSRLLKECGQQVIVANARRVRLIIESSRKNDRLDARTLARLARMDAALLAPIRHRSAQAQQHLIMIRARAALVETRTKLVNTVRGMVKATGKRLRKCSARSMGPAAARQIDDALAQVIKPLLASIESISGQIQQYDRQIVEVAKQYPEVARLDQVWGVGTLIALTYVLTIEDPGRFERSRDVGCYLGLRPRQRQSGARSPELGISKEGDRYLRTLLVQAAHYILGPFGPDTDLRRWGLRLAGHGGKNAKKRAVVAVARKLAILLHRLWVSGERYQPLRDAEIATAA